jgi:fibro-slime domain-containing protein
MKRMTSHRVVTYGSALCALGLIAAAGSISVAGSDDGMPSSITLTGVVRDFRELSVAGGHPDFEAKPASGFAHYMGNVATMLDEDGKPVFTGEGYKVGSEWTDAQGHNICPLFYDHAKGDHAGSQGVSDPGGVHSAASFAQWYRTIPGVNMPMAVSITLNRDPSTGKYVFDDRTDPKYSHLGGFFPINDELFGNSAGNDRNFHFTYELRTEFTYKANSGQVFTFRGDDDVYIYIDGHLVIDIGGVHAAVEQTVDLDRLSWLQDGHKYELAFFFAERHRTQSNCRIETTLNLRTANLPNSSHIYD